MVAGLVDRLLAVPSPLAYALVFLVPALEASVFVGFVIPGESVAVLGGVVASEHHASLAAMAAAAVAGAIVGDSIGYLVGRKLGRPLQRSRLGRIVGDERWARAEDFLRRRGGPAVFLGRWTALLRALVPAAAGMSRLPYRTFVLWNVIGGAAWATTMVVAGYLAGHAYRRLEHYLGGGAFVLLAVIVAGLIARHVMQRRRNAA